MGGWDWYAHVKCGPVRMGGLNFKGGSLECGLYISGKARIYLKSVPLIMSVWSSGFEEVHSNFLVELT